MAGKYLELAVILKAVDQMSSTVSSALGGATSGYNKLANSQERAQLNMQKGMVMGFGAMAAMKVLDALTGKYADVDAAQRQLRISEMKPGGRIDEAAFENEMRLVTALTGLYGEGKAGYIDMIKVMKNYHLEDSDILGGTGKQVALLSKLFQTIPAAGALFASRMKTDFRVMPEEMAQMVDMAVRLKQLNTGLTGQEMLHNLTEFSAGIALSSQNLGMHGAKDASELQILGAMYTSKGIDAPQVATTLRRIFENITKPERLKKMDEAAAKYGVHMQFFDKKGNFEGVDNFVAQLSLLKNLKPSAVTEILGVLGSAQGMSSVMLKNISKFGMDDFLDFKKSYAAQGTPEQKLNEMMGGQTEQIKLATTELENLEIEIGKHYNPAVVQGAKLSRGFFKVLTDFASNHSTTTDISAALLGIATGGMLIGSAFHFMGAAWTYSGMSAMFSAIGGISVSGILAFARSLNYILLPAIRTIGMAMADIAFPVGVIATMIEFPHEWARAISGIFAPLADVPGDLMKKITDQWDYWHGKSPVLPHNVTVPAIGPDGLAPWLNNANHSNDLKIKAEHKTEADNLERDIKKDLLRKEEIRKHHAQQTTIVYSPNVSITGGGEKANFQKMLNDHKHQLLDMVNKRDNDILRTSFR